jgi:ATP-dependent RNA helicase DeaD
MQFISIVKDPNIIKAISELGWEEPTPVQEQTLPVAGQGTDLMAQAQTGTGKTGAFAIPIIGKLEKNRKIQCLVLTPTRELAVQVAEDFGDLGKFADVRTVAIYGGQAITIQVAKLRKGVEVVVGTPGRLIEWILQRVPKNRQTMLFSATLPEAIRDLARRYMKNPREIIVSTDALTVPNAEQIYINVGRKNKLWALCRILDTERPELAMVFCSTKRMVDELARKLKAYGYSADGIHGDLTQAMRDKVMTKFKSGKLRVLIATDVAARGLDIENVTHVFNYDIPENPEDYVHRIGRTARAGKTGKAITFVSKEEQYLVKAIEQFGRTKIQEDDVPKSKGGADTVKRRIDLDEYADHFGMVLFEINVGRKDGIDMMNMIRFVERKTGIRENLIGSVDIEDDRTRLEIHKTAAFRAMKDLEKCHIHNKRVRIDIVKNRPM